MDSCPPDPSPERSLTARGVPMHLPRFVLILLASTILAATAQADTTGGSTTHQITSLPYTITSPGVYFLNANFSPGTNIDAITVQTDGVTIDLNGHTISGEAIGNAVTCAAISCNGPSRLTVRNGTIRGYAYGIYIGSPGGSASASHGHLVENVRFLGCTYTAVALAANGSIIRHCQAYKIGGSSQPFLPNGVGFLTFFYFNSVLDCDVSELTSTNPASYPTVGIYADTGSGTLLVNNRIGGAHYGIAFNSGGSGKYRDNLCAASVTIPYFGGTDAGNN